MEMHKSSFEIPSEEYNKQISNANISLRVNAGYLPIAEALKSFINYDKVAIITRHSIRGEDYSASGPLTNLGKIVAENLGKKLKAEFGERTITLYSTDTVRTRDTASLINKGWNDIETSEIDTSKDIINGDYFEVSGTWPEITESVQTPEFKDKVETWKSDFISEMPDGLSWWVSHDSLLVPLVYNLGNFNPEKYKQLYKLNKLPWVSPLTGLIIAIKNDDIQIEVITCLKDGFISSDDYDHDYSNELKETRLSGDLVATTFTHPRVDDSYILKPDLSYIFDHKAIPESNPLYCQDNTYEGCGQCIACQNCDAGCQTDCQQCDGCNACQTCFSCQSKCQNGEYNWTLYKEKITQCSSCVECNICVNRYTKSYVTACSPCNSCYTTEQVATWSECSGCQWGCTSCTSCNGCNDNSVAACVQGTSVICSPCVSCHASCTSCNHCNGCDSCNSCYKFYYQDINDRCPYRYSCSICTGCAGCTNSCHGCTGKCYGCNGCTSCTGCQNCTGCQAACTGHCQGGCYGGCISCNSKTTPTGYKCDGCTNEQPITRCVPNCETGCYKGCTADNSYRYKRYNCNDLCMTCVGIDEYACTSCYQENYDVEYR